MAHGSANIWRGTGFVAIVFQTQHCRGPQTPKEFGIHRGEFPMRALRLFIAGTLLSLCTVHAQAEPTSPAEQEIRQLEADINAAYAANDLPKYFAYYADDFRGLFPEGPTTLPEYVKTWTDFINSGGAIQAFTYSELQVQVSPGADAAVASYRATVRTKNPGKEPVMEMYFETDVFFKRAGHWKLVEVHYSPEPGKK